MALERRSYPRYPVNCAVRVAVPDPGEDSDFPATCNTLSRTSIQIECGADLIAALLRQQRLPYTCQLEFTLPWHTHGFTIPAHAVTHRRLSQRQYVLVLLLRHADEAQEGLLDNLLSERQPIAPD